MGIKVVTVVLILKAIFGNCAQHTIPRPNSVPVGAHLTPNPKQTFQQFQVAVVLPPGAEPSQKPGEAAAPGYVWLQVPASYVPGQGQVPLPPPPSPPLSSSSPSPPSISLLPPSPLPAPPPISAVPPQHTPGVQQPPSTFPPSINEEVLNRKCLQPRGQFPSSACNKYVNCWDGVAIEQFCPEGLVFNPRGFCDYPENVDCRGRPHEGQLLPVPIQPQPPTITAPLPPGSPSLPAPVPVITTDPTLKKKCLRPRGQFPSNSCDKYVNCWDDNVIEQDCPPGLLFSTKGYCDYPHNVNCQNRIPSRNVEEENSKECPIAFGTFRDKSDCGNYFTCVAGKVAARYTCPVGLKFNDYIGVCDYSDRVDCSKEPLVFLPNKLFDPAANFFATIPQDTLVKLGDCQPGSLLRLNPQCTAVSLCRDGLSEIVQCPDGLAYDSKTDKCLLPHIAKC